MPEKKTYLAHYKGEKQPRRVSLTDEQLRHFERAAKHDGARLQRIAPAPAEEGDGK